MVSKKMIFALLAGFFLLTACQQTTPPSGRDKGLTAIATIYPLYDFARRVGGNHVSVTMLLPPASDAHHYELKPDDIIRIKQTDVFIFTSFEMEQWAYKVIGAAAEKTNMTAVEAGRGAAVMLLGEKHDHDADHPSAGHDHTNKYDPHIWLDFENAQKMVDNIADAFIRKDPQNGETYKKNAQAYKQELQELDREYRKQLSGCKSRTLLHAGHWAFAYLAKRYHLNYLAAYNMSADAEPSPQQIVALIETVKAQKLKYIYYEDLIAPKLAKIIAEETGVGLLKLNNGHDIGKRDIENGETFISLMKKNLIHLKAGLQCP